VEIPKFFILRNRLDCYTVDIKSDKHALIISIIKWAHMCEILKTRIVADNGPSTCGLCLFNQHNCMGCIIMLKTGRDSCSRTPYENFAKVMFERGDGYYEILDELSYAEKEEIRKTLRGIAIRELKFLQELYVELYAEPYEIPNLEGLVQEVTEE
jgi:hypothetical protein